MLLTEQQVTDYRDRGWLVLDDVFGADELEVLRTAALEVISQ